MSEQKTYRSPIERPEECVGKSILGSCDLGFRFEDRVDAADCGRAVSTRAMYCSFLIFATDLDWLPLWRSRIGRDL